MSTLYEDIRNSAAFGDLLVVSERLGRNPLQVQAAGGNTSLKREGAMWVKASGKWLAHAREDDIMVPVDAVAMRDALERDDAIANDANAFRVSGGLPELRASIETSLHALLDWPVVAHTHCVATVATAVRTNAADIVADVLSDLGALYIPYAKPGRDLAMVVRSVARPDTRALVLGNHGLVACGETAAEAEALVQAVSARLAPDLPANGTGDNANVRFADWLSSYAWKPVPSDAMAALVSDPARVALAEGNALYPDHVVFLGPGVAVARDGESPDTASTRAATSGVAPKLVLYPNQGAAVPNDASESAMALAACLADVVMRIDLSAKITRLSDSEVFDLINWDAEKHRQALDKKPG